MAAAMLSPFPYQDTGAVQSHLQPDCTALYTAQLLMLYQQQMLAAQASVLGDSVPPFLAMPPATDLPREQPPAVVTPVSATATAQRRNRRKKKAKSTPQEEKGEEVERRVDPTDKRLKTEEEFLMDHAVAVDFSKGEQLWEAAAKKGAHASAPPPAMVVPIQEKSVGVLDKEKEKRGVRFAVVLETTVPRKGVPTPSILKDRSRVAPPLGSDSDSHPMEESL
eukprot:Hpha_TRINITY_DN15420_c1_g3::TRINITY_DN15420_c1_g3_i1::g.176900::m.176900